MSALAFGATNIPANACTSTSPAAASASVGTPEASLSSGGARTSTQPAPSASLGATPASRVSAAVPTVCALTLTFTVTYNAVPSSRNFLFTVNDGAVNPTPTTTLLNPVSATAGGAAFTLTVTGTNYLPIWTINWNGAGRSTTYIDGAHLSIAIAAADIATAGSASVTVTNPAPGGGTSNAQSFPIAAVTQACSAVRLMGSPAPPQALGTPIAVTAAASPCSLALYQFWLLPPAAAGPTLKPTPAAPPLVGAPADW